MDLVRQGTLFRCGETVLAPDPPEAVLVKMYGNWKETGVLDWVFYQEPISLFSFLKWFMRGNATSLGAYRLNADGLAVPVGLVWINETFTLPGGFKRMEVGMGFVRHAEPDWLYEAGAMAVEWAFSFREADALLGTTPVRNRAAIRYGKRLGFTVVGPVYGMATWQGKLEPVMVQSITREQWGERSPFRGSCPDIGQLG